MCNPSHLEKQPSPQDDANLGAKNDKQKYSLLKAFALKYNLKGQEQLKKGDSSTVHCSSYLDARFLSLVPKLETIMGMSRNGHGYLS